MEEKRRKEEGKEMKGREGKGREGKLYGITYQEKNRTKISKGSF